MVPVPVFFEIETDLHVKKLPIQEDNKKWYRYRD
jgi:hypothetical protein